MTDEQMREAGFGCGCRKCLGGCLMHDGVKLDDGYVLVSSICNCEVDCVNETL